MLGEFSLLHGVLVSGNILLRTVCTYAVLYGELWCWLYAMSRHGACDMRSYNDMGHGVFLVSSHRMCIHICVLCCGMALFVLDRFCQVLAHYARAG